MTLTVEDLAYDLPDQAIATTFASPRERAGMLVSMSDGPPVDASVADLWRFIRPGDVVVLNATQSRASRLRMIGPSGSTELIAIEPVTETKWIIRVPASLAVREGERLAVAGSEAGVTLVQREHGDCWVGQFDGLDAPVESLLEAHGRVPLPPYASVEDVDRERMRTMFGHDRGSAAPPTAGLHLSREVLDRCVAAGATLAELTLHVSLRTSRYRLIDPDRPALHSERFHIPEATIDACRSARRTIAIGTTVVRALETFATTGSSSGATSIFLSRGHEFSYVDVLFTNFQAPRSTMLAMVDAFTGPRWRQVYAAGLDRGYRFLALGDACLLAGRKPRGMRS